jgi:hypothetical protein
MSEFNPFDQPRWKNWPCVDNLGDVDDQLMWAKTRIQQAVGREGLERAWTQTDALLAPDSLEETWIKGKDRQAVLDSIEWQYGD